MKKILLLIIPFSFFFCSKTFGQDFEPYVFDKFRVGFSLNDNLLLPRIIGNNISAELTFSWKNSMISVGPDIYTGPRADTSFVGGLMRYRRFFFPEKKRFHLYSGLIAAHHSKNILFPVEILNYSPHSSPWTTMTQGKIDIDTYSLGAEIGVLFKTGKRICFFSEAGMGVSQILSKSKNYDSFKLPSGNTYFMVFSSGFCILLGSF